MASTTQEKIMPLDGMPFAEFADPSYFVFANRNARMAQERKIVPGMAWNLFNGTMPETTPRTIPKRESIEEIISPMTDLMIFDEKGEEINFQDPWEGIRESHNLIEVRNAVNDPLKPNGSDFDVTCFFFGY